MSQIESFIEKTDSIHSVMSIVKGMCILQVNGVDLAIPFLVGNPGMAKTALSKQMCFDSSWGFYSIHFGLIPIEEIGGLPQFHQLNQDEVGTRWSKPDMLTKLEILSKKHEIVVCLFDDVHVCSQSHFNLMYEIFTERALRGYKFPDNVAFIMAGNPSAKAGAKPIPSAIINRGCYLPVHLDFEDWKRDFALKNRLHGGIVAFLSNTKNEHCFHEAEQVSKPWASPRSWTRFSNLLTSMEEGLGKSLPSRQVLYWGSAHVGEEKASLFSTYYKLFRNINTKDIFDGKQPINVPTDMQGAYIYMMAMIDEFFNRFIDAHKNKKQNTTGKLIDTLAQLIVRCAKNSFEEIAVPSLKEVVMTSGSLGYTTLYQDLRRSISRVDDKIREKLTGLVKEI